MQPELYLLYLQRDVSLQHAGHEFIRRGQIGPPGRSEHHRGRHIARLLDQHVRLLPGPWEPEFRPGRRPSPAPGAAHLLVPEPGRGPRPPGGRLPGPTAELPLRERNIRVPENRPE